MKAHKTGYLASLDGWRALSILAVLADHSRTFYVRGYSLRAVQDFGGEGVVIFFAISGLLICTRLVEEEKLLGRVNLKGFYIRRTLRIQPAAVLYLLAVALVSAVGWVPQNPKYWFGALLLYRNYQVHLVGALVDVRGYLTGHYWTLAVEEHFYLLLSLFLFFVRSRRVVLLGIAFVVAFYSGAVVSRLFPHLNSEDVARHTEFQLQFLLPSALAALLLMQPPFAAWTRRWLPPGPVIALTIAYATVSVFLHRAYGTTFMAHHKRLTVYLMADWYVLYLRMFPIWVLATVTHPRSWTTRFLELRGLVWVGRISYSLYLWHVLFFRGPWPATVPQPLSPLVALTYAPWNLIASFVAATASFYLVERPLMRLGHKLAPPSTPGRLDMQDEPSIEEAIEPSHTAAARS